MSTYTAGKWEVTPRIDEGYRVCVDGNQANAIADLDEWQSMKETEANAHLIAQAPALLAAIKELLKEVDQHCESDCPKFIAACKTARAVILNCPR